MPNLRQPTAGPHMPTVRRLAAIVAADVAGYSRLMETELDAMAEAASILALITR